MHLAVFLLIHVLSIPQNLIQARDASAIEAAKNTTVRRLDPSLPDKAFAIWLRDLVGPEAEIKWEVNDCGEQTGNPSVDKGRDFPMCTETEVAIQGACRLHVVLSVGTFRTGIKAGSASFFYAVLIKPDGSRIWIKNLSRLPEAIKAHK